MSSTRKTNPVHSTREILNQLNRLIKGNETGNFLSDYEKSRIRTSINWYTTLDKKFKFNIEKEANKGLLKGKNNVSSK